MQERLADAVLLRYCFNNTGLSGCNNLVTVCFIFVWNTIFTHISSLHNFLKLGWNSRVWISIFSATTISFKTCSNNKKKYMEIFYLMIVGDWEYVFTYCLLVLPRNFHQNFCLKLSIFFQYDSDWACPTSTYYRSVNLEHFWSLTNDVINLSSL